MTPIILFKQEQCLLAEKRKKAHPVRTAQMGGENKRECVLLTGDINEKTISIFLLQKTNLVDVLEMLHHG